MNGNPIGCAAGLVTLDELEKEGVYPQFYEISDRLRQGLESRARARGIPCQVIGEGPVLQTVFSDLPIRTHADGLRADAGAAQCFGIEMIRRGIFVAPGGKLYLSLAHTAADVDQTLEAAEQALQAIQPALSR
jgi:glutamate-1-semialdehyde 2,1-aminomutase